MRIIFKMLLLPVRLLIFIIMMISKLILSSGLILLALRFIGGLFFLLGAVCLIGFLPLPWFEEFTWHWPSLVLGLLALGASYIFNPFTGIGVFLAWLIEKLEDLRDAIKSI